MTSHANKNNLTVKTNFFNCAKQCSILFGALIFAHFGYRDICRFLFSSTSVSLCLFLFVIHSLSCLVHVRSPMLLLLLHHVIFTSLILRHVFFASPMTSRRQLMPKISSLNPLTTVVPLSAVLLITAIKDAHDDVVSFNQHYIMTIIGSENFF